MALLIERLLITRLYERHIDQALVTVGVALVVGAMLTGWFGPDGRLLPVPIWFYNTVHIAGAMVPLDRFLCIGTALIFFLVITFLLRFARIGLIIRAGVAHRAMVTALGIHVIRALSTVFFFG